MTSRIKDIEFLRGIAIIMVIVYHAKGTLISWPVASWNNIVSGYFDFWPGVDIFFAVSGFVIARSLIPTLRSCATGADFSRAAIGFWIRRVWRLLPSAWLWLIMIVLASRFFNRTGIFDSFHTNFESMVAGMLSVANFRELAVSSSHYGASSPYWSLSLEEQFYLALPIIVFLSRRRLVATLLIGTIAIFLVPESPALVMFRVHAVLLGVLLAIASAHPLYQAFEPVALKTHRFIRIVILGLPLALISALAVEGQRIVPFRLDLIALLSAALVFIASYNRDYLFDDGPVKRVVLWVGSRSYALYLTHVFAFCVTREIWYRLSPPGTVFGPGYGVAFVLTAGVIMVALSEANYRLVEIPLREHGARIAKGFARRVNVEQVQELP